MKVSAVIITFNEERNIDRCLSSLQGMVDEILVVDSYSEDRTAEICQLYGVRFEQHPFEGHIQQKNYAMQLAAHDWVLSLDADEALTPELADALMSARKGAVATTAFELKRLTNFCGKWIRHTGWYPDPKVRLWNRNHGQWGGQNPHDRVVLSDGVKVCRLSGDLVHYSFYTLEEHVAQIQKFSSIAARAAYDNGKRSHFLVHILLGPLFNFFKKYFLQAGFLDGYYGFVISYNTAYYKFLKYAKLREIQQAQ